MRTLVITSCSAEKRGEVPEPARAEELADPIRRRRAEARLAPFATTAVQMYTGAHHRLVMEGVQAVWDRWGQQALDVAILSGGYGLLRAGKIIIPYDVTFDQFDEAELLDWLTHLRIREKASALVGEYDLVFLLLSGRYLSALELPLGVPDSVQQIVLTGQGSLALVPSAPNLHPFVAAEGEAARRWHVKAPYVRGFLFRRLCGQIVHHGPGVLEWLYRQPQDTERLFYKRARWRPQLSLL